MAAIKPFRHLIVYPPMMRHIERNRQASRRMNAEPGTGRGARPGGSKERDSASTVRQQQPVPEEIRSLSTMADPDYVDVFTMTGGVPGRPPKQWARAMFEDVAGLDKQFLWRLLPARAQRAYPHRQERSQT